MNVELIAYTQGTTGETPTDIEQGIAQVSYKTDSDTSLSNALKRGHLSLLEHVSFTFLVRGLSRVSQQQLTRHRMASYTIESQRRVEQTPDFICPKTISNLPENSEALKLFRDAHILSWKAYQSMLAAGVPKEDARYILPEGQASGTIILTMNMRELRHFFQLRMAPSAQWEIRALATKMFFLVHERCPGLLEGAEE